MHTRDMALFTLLLPLAAFMTGAFGQPETVAAAQDDKCVEIEIPSSLDGTLQKAFCFIPESGAPAPLAVSLHSWSGDYAQEDPLAAKVIAAGWNYVHPDFRGPNHTPDACLSEKVIADINDAIQYVLGKKKVDPGNIFVVGGSGGGYAALGFYLRTRHPVRLFLSWVPISDLTAWYWESRNRGNKYADDIVRCTSVTGEFDEAGARERSPLYWDMPTKPIGRIEIYAGIQDGCTGSVPVSHSLRFFNKLATHAGRTDACVPEEDMMRLLARGMGPDPALGKLADRAVYYRREIPGASVTIFEGGHELLADYCFDRMRLAVEENSLGSR